MKRTAIFFTGLVFTFGIVMVTPMVRADSAADNIAVDMEDPMFINRLGDFGSQTSIDIGKYVQIREIVSYGFSNRFTVDADIRWRSGYRNYDSGISNLGLLGLYRAGESQTGATDVLFGFGFGGQGAAPNYSDSVYSVGLRTGRQWKGMTLSAMIMTNWIFEKDSGIAYIDLSPDAYFRIVNNWSIGIGATLRKSTTGALDQQWVNVKFGSQVGKTGWFGNVGYEFESKDWRIGGSLNMLF